MPDGLQVYTKTWKVSSIQVEGHSDHTDKPG